MSVHGWHWVWVVAVAIAVIATACAAPATPLVSPTVARPTASPSITVEPATPIPTPSATTEAATPIPTPSATTEHTMTPVSTTVAVEPASPHPSGVATVEPATPVQGGGANQKLNLDDLAPPGRGRDLVLENCGSCHPFFCPFLGQKTVGHWKTVRANHKVRVPNLSAEDLNILFTYLEENFNDQKPEPNLPPELQQLSCSSGVR